MKNELINNNNIVLIQEKHPWQPDWVKTKEDVDTFLELLDNYKFLCDNSMNWYPPYLIFLETINDKEYLGMINSQWKDYYCPFKEGKKKPLEIIDNYINS